MKPDFDEFINDGKLEILPTTLLKNIFLDLKHNSLVHHFLWISHLLGEISQKPRSIHQATNQCLSQTLHKVQTEAHKNAEANMSQSEQRKEA